MKNFRKHLSVLFVALILSCSAYAQNLVKQTKAINPEITESGILHVVVKVNESFNNGGSAGRGDFGVVAHEEAEFDGWNSGLAKAIFEYNEGFPRIGWWNGAFDNWSADENKKSFNLGDTISIWFHVNVAAGTYSVYVQLQTEAEVTLLGSNLIPRAISKNYTPRDKAAYLTVFINGRWNNENVIDIIKEAKLVDAIEPYFEGVGRKKELVFYDNFNQEPVNPIASSGEPVVDYSVWTTVEPTAPGGGTALIEEYESEDGMLKLLARHSASEQTGNRTEVSAPLSVYNESFNAVLSSNSDVLEWIFTARQNRNSAGGTNGFSGTQTGMAVVLASDSSIWDTQSGSNAKGYAITFLKPEGSMYCVSLSRFDGGLSNYTVIAGNKQEDVFSDFRTWVTVKVTYDPKSNEWSLFFRDELSTTTKGDVSNSAAMKLINTVVDDTFTDIEMTHYGFALNTPAPGASGADWNAFMVDDYTVSLGSVIEERFVVDALVEGNGGQIVRSLELDDYPSGSLIEFRAVPDAGFIFDKWSGDVNSLLNPLRITINSDMVIKANFIPIQEPDVKGKLIHYEETFLEAVKSEIEKNNSFFVSAYNTLISEANKELNKAADPVTNKTQTPPSGSKNDYLSLAPYWWPDPNKPDGLPWIHKDGQVNPMTRGNNTDQVRLSNFFDAMEVLSFAYYFSSDMKYANKAIELLNVWLVNSETRVNPHANFAQGIPGKNTGRQIGIIEWSSVYKVIAAMQIMENKGVLPGTTKTGVDDWLSEWSVWLRTSSFGIKESNMGNNHGTKYDFQVLGLLLYEGRTADATKLVNDFKTKRIASQIQPNGAQPSELSRTKSVNYSTMNLWGMTQVAQMGWQVGIDLWGFETSDGRSIRQAFNFLSPYLQNPETWTWEQITNGGKVNALNTLTKPLFSKASTIFNEDLIDHSENAGNQLSYLDKLIYPPRERLFIGEDGKAYIFINVNNNHGTVSKTPDRMNYDSGETLELTAEPNPGYKFVNWTGDITSDENPLNIQLDSNMSITANFVPIFTVSISNNTVNGTVEVSPVKDYYEEGETITFVPYPATGYRFDSWHDAGGISGNTVPLEISINRDIELTANFNLITYQLFVTANNGSVTRSPQSVAYAAGTEVELTATPNEGYIFTGWSGYITGEENPITITMDSIIYVTANFDKISSVDQKGGDKFKIYPNPSAGVFTVRVEQPVNYMVYTLNGVLVEEGYAPETFNIDLTEYNNSIYIIQVISSDGVSVKRLIKR